MAPYQFSFEKLEVWQLSRQLAGEIYRVTKAFPAEEKYSLVSQIRRSAVSVSANIAEGTSRQTAKDQAHFTVMAFSSLMELFNHLIIATDLTYINEIELSSFREKIQPLSVKLSNLKASQVKRIGNLKLLWLLIIGSQILQPILPLQS